MRLFVRGGENLHGWGYVAKVPVRAGTRGYPGLSVDIHDDCYSGHHRCDLSLSLPAPHLQKKGKGRLSTHSLRETTFR